jgi:hypothetical protein
MWMRPALLFVTGLMVARSEQTVSGPEGDCGFSRLRPQQIAHFVERGVVSKIEPLYPPAAKDKGVVGNVRIRIRHQQAGIG